MKLLFTLFLVVSTAFVCFGDDVNANEIHERRDLVKDTGRHEKDYITAISEYKIAETAGNKMEDTYAEERKKRCLPRIRDCITIMDCCNGHACRCNNFGQKCKCKPRAFYHGIDQHGMECCK